MIEYFEIFLTKNADEQKGRGIPGMQIGVIDKSGQISYSKRRSKAYNPDTLR